MIFGIVVIGVIGLISDFLFKALNRKLFRPLESRREPKLAIIERRRRAPSPARSMAASRRRRCSRPTLSVADKEFVAHPGPLRLRQVHAAADRSPGWTRRPPAA